MTLPFPPLKLIPYNTTSEINFAAWYATCISPAARPGNPSQERDKSTSSDMTAGHAQGLLWPPQLPSAPAVGAGFGTAAAHYARPAPHHC